MSVLRTAELLLEAGAPPGVVNVVTGLGRAAGSALANHPGVNRIAFTGSTATGRRIIEASTVNIKKVQLELGGKSPDIIFADADLDEAVRGACMGVFANSGADLLRRHKGIRTAQSNGGILRPCGGFRQR